MAFALDRPLAGPHCGQLDVLAATGHLVPSIEIIDARVQRRDPETRSIRTIVDSISDNAAAAGVILGGRAQGPADTDLCRLAGVLYRNGQIEETGVSAGVMNHPANAVAWLANKLWSYDEKLLAGQVILGGSFVRAVSAAKGDTFHADFGPAGAASVQFI